MLPEPTRFYVDFRYNGVVMDWWTPTNYMVGDFKTVKEQAYKSIRHRTWPPAWDFDVYEAEVYSVPLNDGAGGIERHYSKGKHIYFSV